MLQSLAVLVLGTFALETSNFGIPDPRFILTRIPCTGQENHYSNYSTASLKSHDLIKILLLTARATGNTGCPQKMLCSLSAHSKFNLTDEFCTKTCKIDLVEPM
jgi:hypothetical protein